MFGQKIPTHCATITLFLNLRLLSLLQGTWAGTKKDTFLELGLMQGS